MSECSHNRTRTRTRPRPRSSVLFGLLVLIIPGVLPPVRPHNAANPIEDEDDDEDEDDYRCSSLPIDF
jgi:hypothetical protein